MTGPEQRECGQDSDDGKVCFKLLPDGLDYHGGGHMFAAPDLVPRIRARIADGHYDASALLAGLPTEHHEPQDCHPACAQWRGPRPG